MKFKNKLNTLLVVSGCDFLFEPNEEREFNEDSPYVAFLEKCTDIETRGGKQEIPEPEVYDEKTCFICGFKAKTVNGLNVHRRKKHNL